MKTKIQRIPRPLGVTLQAQSLNTSANKQEELKKIKDHILNLYFINNQTVNNKPLTIDEVSSYLQLDTMYIIRYLYKRMGYMQGMGPDSDLEDTAQSLRVIKNWAIKKSLNHSQTADLQLGTMLKSQGGKYKPYISGEVNRAISGALAADKNLLDLYRTLDQSHRAASPNHYLVPGSNPQSESDALTPEKAIKLMNTEQPMRLLTEPQLKDQLKEQYNIDDLPEVRANYQQGVDTDGSLIPTTDTAATIVSSKVRHEVRRESDFEDDDEIV